MLVREIWFPLGKNCSWNCHNAQRSCKGEIYE